MTNTHIQDKISEWPFLKSTLKSVLSSLPDVTDTKFEASADMPLFTDEAICKCIVKISPETEIRLVFNLYGGKVYPATPKTKKVIETLEASYKMHDTKLPRLSSLVDPTRIGDRNAYETPCSPQVLGVKPLKEAVGSAPKIANNDLP